MALSRFLLEGRVPAKTIRPTRHQPTVQAEPSGHVASYYRHVYMARPSGRTHVGFFFFGFGGPFGLGPPRLERRLVPGLAYGVGRGGIAVVV